MAMELGVNVAPPAGAWIETSPKGIPSDGRGPSHPLRVRGLKHTGVSSYPRVLLSHPLRVRGLKLTTVLGANPPLPSHPLRVRGLKQDIVGEAEQLVIVAPPAGAWIETLTPQ